MDRFDLDTTDFEEAWRMYSHQALDNGYSAESIAKFRHMFMAGGAMATGVLSNRLSKLPGTVEPGQMVQALIDTIAGALAELEQKTGLHHKGSA